MGKNSSFSVLGHVKALPSPSRNIMFTCGGDKKKNFKNKTHIYTCIHACNYKVKVEEVLKEGSIFGAINIVVSNQELTWT